LVHSRILYAVAIYGNTYLSYLHDLMVLNNRLLRILQPVPRTTGTISLYLSYKTLPINKLFISQILLHAFKLLFFSDTLPIVFHRSDLINSHLHLHNTRNKSDFHLATYTSIAGSKISDRLCAKFWNNLPLYLKESRSIESFNRGVKEFLLQVDF